MSVRRGANPAANALSQCSIADCVTTGNRRGGKGRKAGAAFLASLWEAPENHATLPPVVIFHPQIAGFAL